MKTPFPFSTLPVVDLMEFDNLVPFHSANHYTHPPFPRHSLSLSPFLPAKPKALFSISTSSQETNLKAPDREIKGKRDTVYAGLWLCLSEVTARRLPQAVTSKTSSLFQ